MTSRRTFLKQNSLAAAGVRVALAAPFVMTPARSAPAAPAAPVADTATGKLRGRTQDGIHVFRGVPYGADTSGKNRFMPPKKPAPWQGTMLSSGAASRPSRYPAGTTTTPARCSGLRCRAEEAKTAWC